MDQHQQREMEIEALKAELDAEWQGSGSWLPVGIPSTGRGLGADALKGLLEATRAAKHHGIALNTLLQPAGKLRLAIEESSKTRNLSVLKGCQKFVQDLAASEEFLEMAGVNDGPAVTVPAVADTLDEAPETPSGVQMSSLGQSLLSPAPLQADAALTPVSQSLVNLISDAPPSAPPVDRKRKREKPARPTVHLIDDSPTPPPKRPCSIPPLDAKAYAQLTSTAQLTDDVMLMVANALMRKYGTKNTRLLDPLWFNTQSPNSIPQQIRSFPALNTVYYFIIHHADASHWALGAITTTVPDAVHCYYFDSIASSARSKSVQARLGRWMKKVGGNHRLVFREQVCPQQEDGSSCGVFVLSALEMMLRRAPFPKTLDPMAERGRFFALVRPAAESPETKSLVTLPSDTKPSDTKPSDTSAPETTSPDTNSIAALISRPSLTSLRSHLDKARIRLTQAQKSCVVASQAVLKAKGAKEALSSLVQRALPKATSSLRSQFPSELGSQSDSAANLVANLGDNLNLVLGSVSRAVCRSAVDGGNIIVAQVEESLGDIAKEVDEAEAALLKARRERTVAERAVEQLESVVKAREALEKVPKEGLEDLMRLVV